jgi:hypothetical protein
MKLRHHACLGLGLLVASCDKPNQAHSPAAENPDAPRVTKKIQRPTREDRPDARSMLRSAHEIEAQEARDKAIAKLAWDALELDPDLAREAMDKLTPGSPERIRLTQHLAMRMAEENVDSALTWAATLDNAHENAAAIGHIALVLADSDPERAGKLLSESGIEGRDFDVVVVQVLGRWAAQSPADAAAWVALFPAGASREAGIRSVVSIWVEADAAGALSWMTALQDDTVRGETIRAMAEALVSQPEEVRKQLLDHADPSLRAEIAMELELTKKEAGNRSLPPFE